MRFRLVSCIKLTVVLAILFTSLMIFENNENSKNIHRNITREDLVTSSLLETNADLGFGDASDSDSLSGNRIDGLPNITETRLDIHTEPPAFDPETAEILDNIAIANTEQVEFTSKSNDFPYCHFSFSL